MLFHLHSSRAATVTGQRRDGCVLQKLPGQKPNTTRQLQQVSCMQQSVGGWGCTSSGSRSVHHLYDCRKTNNGADSPLCLFMSLSHHTVVLWHLHSLPSLLVINQRMVPAQLYHHLADGPSHSAQHVEGRQWAQRQQKRRHPQHVMEPDVLFAVLFCFCLSSAHMTFHDRLICCSSWCERAHWITWRTQDIENAVCF